MQYISFFIVIALPFLFIEVLSSLDSFFFFLSLYLLYDPKIHIALSSDLLSIVFGSSIS